MNGARGVAARIVGSGILIAANAAHATEIQCPETLTETPSVQSPDPRWTVLTKTAERPVNQAGIYLVADGEYSAQIPDSTHQTGRREERVTWRMTGSPNEKFAVGCSYTGTTAMLYKPIEAVAKRCVVTYALLPTGRRQRLQSVKCD